MSTMLFEMGAAIAGEFGAAPRANGEDSCRFIIDTFIVAAAPAEGAS